MLLPSLFILFADLLSLRWTVSAFTPMPAAGAMLRFACAELVVERLDPIVSPGQSPFNHVHQIVGGDAFGPSMEGDFLSAATCTSCQPIDDLSNYWTAVLYFRAQNGSFHRVRTFGDNLGYADAHGGQIIYYLTNGSTVAFQPGFRMTAGDPTLRAAAQLEARYQSLFFTCLTTPFTRGNATTHFPEQPCPAGIMVTTGFPTCWDGTNLDSPDHQSHVAYADGAGACPCSHPVRLPLLFMETFWETRPWNEMWPTDGTQPFVWSFGDRTGYGIHADYVFGWRGDALQRALDANCTSDLFSDELNCPSLRVQEIAQANRCTKRRQVNERLDGWVDELPGGLPVTP